MKGEIEEIKKYGQKCMHQFEVAKKCGNLGAGGGGGEGESSVTREIVREERGFAFCG